MRAKYLWAVGGLALVTLVAALVLVGSAAPSGITERVSVDSAGNQGNDSSGAPAINADGRYVSFLSEAVNLVPDDTNGVYDVFVHDRLTGETTRVSVDSAGVEGNGTSYWNVISADGRYVAFESDATNLVPNDNNSMTDIFVHDRVTGETTRVSVDSSGIEGNRPASKYGAPAISADGRYVAFQSHASNLVPEDTNDRWDIFVHDCQTGVTERVSVSSAGYQGNHDSGGPAISADGRYVAFSSFAWNLAPGDYYGPSDIFVHDRLTGTTEKLTAGNFSSSGPAISGDGRFVAFDSSATNLVPGDTAGLNDIFVHDRLNGTTERVSVSSSGEQGNQHSTTAKISADGRYVAFDSVASNLVPDDTNTCGFPWSCPDVFVHDRQTGTTERINVDNSGNQANGGSGVPAISADGRYVAFGSSASNLVPDDTNACPGYASCGDAFVRDRCPDGVCGGGPTPTPETPTPAPEPFRYIATGDSIPAGADLASPYSEAYPAGLKLLLSFRVAPVEDINMACSDTSSSQYLATDRCGHTQLQVTLDNDPDLVTITLGADDKALPYLASPEAKVDSCIKKLPDFSKALQCARGLKANGRAKWWTETQNNLKSILDRYQGYLDTHPDALVVVTNYYNPMRQPYSDTEWTITKTAICSGLAAPFPPPLNGVVFGWCDKEFADANGLLKEVDSIINRLNTEVATAVRPFEASSGGRIRLVNIHDQFIGHCSPLLMKVAIGVTFKVANLGCSESDSWIVPKYSFPFTAKFRGTELGGIVTGGVHPNENGQWLIANIIWNAIKGQLP